MVKGIATTAPGLEPLLEAELAQAGAKPAGTVAGGRGLVAFETPDPAATARLLGHLRTAHRLGHVLAETRVGPADPWSELEGIVHGVDLAPWMDTTSTYAVRCTRRGDHAFDSMDVERQVGAFVFERLGEDHGGRPTVDLDHPDVVLRVRLGPQGQVVMWIDLVGYRSLHRRGYRAYPHHASMKGSLASGLLQMMGYDGQGLLVDPMAGSGTLGIEALWSAHGVPPVALRRDELTLWGTPCFRDADRQALLPVPALPDAADGPPQATATLGDIHPPHVEALQANARAAGVASGISTYTGDIRELADQVDACRWLVANPPYGMRSSSPKEVDRVYRTLFEQADQVLEADGKLGLMTPLDDLVTQLAEEHGFELEDRRSVMHGRLSIELFVLRC